MSNPNAIVEIGGDNRGLKKALNESSSLVAKFATNMASVQTVAAQGIQSAAGGFATLAVGGIAQVAGLAAVVGAAAITMANNTAAAANEVGKLSVSSGLGAQALQELGYAFTVNGVSSQEFAQGMKGLAVRVNEAANGNQEAQATFKALGVEVRDSSGKIRPMEEILYDVAEAFKKMPDGAQKSALAVKLMEEAGLKLLPVLTQGADSIKRFADEAKNIGVIFTPEQIAAAKEWEQNMARIRFATSSLGRDIGNQLVPTMARLSSILLENKGAGLSWFDSLMAALTGQNDPAKRVADLTQRLAELKAKQKELADQGIKPDAGLDANIAGTEAAIKQFQEKAKAVANAEGETAKKRQEYEETLSTKKVELAKYVSYIQKGELSLIEGKAKESVDAQIADQQRLVDAVRSAWQTSLKEAEKAKGESDRLFDAARNKRTGAADKAFDASTKGLSEEDKSAAYAQQAQGMFDQGRYFAAAAGAAQLDGRLKEMEAYAKKADEFLSRAESFAGKSGDSDLMQGIAEAQAQALEAQAKAKAKEAADLNQQAAAQAQTLNELQGKLDALKESARSIQVQLKVDELKNGIADIEAKLQELTKPRTIPVTVAQTGAAATGETTTSTPGFASGGWIRGPGSGTSDSILARLSNGEYVIKAAAVSHYGASLLHQINSMRIPRFATGGLVSRSAIDNLAIPGLRSGGSPESGAGKSTVVLDFGKLGRFETEARQDVASEVVALFKRTALAHGFRR